MASPRRGEGVRWTFSTAVCVLLAVSALGDVRQFSEFYFTNEPQDMTVERDVPAMFNCSAVGSPKPTVEWKKDGTFLNLFGETRRSILNNGSLRFSSIIHNKNEKPDEGLYQCVASVDSLGTIVSRMARLQVATLSRFEREPQATSVHMEENLRLECRIQGSPKPDIRWLKDGKDIEHDLFEPYIQAERGITILPSGALEIAYVQYTDAGRYKCVAANPARERESAEAAVSVLPALEQVKEPELIVLPEDMTVLEGQTVVLECVVNAMPEADVIWSFGGQDIDTGTDSVDRSGSRHSIIGVSNLRIENARESDSGMYRCTGENDHGSVTASAQLIVNVPPKFMTTPSNTYAHERSDIEFECDVYAKPAPHISWIKNGDAVIPSDYFQIQNGQNLRILGLVRSDEGMYQCVATNEYGSIQSSAQLIIVDPDVPLPTMHSLTTPTPTAAAETPTPHPVPSRPRDVVAVTVSTRFVALSWRMPAESHGEIVACSVYFKQEGSNRERVVNTTRYNLEEVDVRDLQPSTSYVFRVVAYNANGPGESSDPIYVQTQPEVHVPGPATSLQAVSVSPVAISVSWQPPNQRNGVILNYKLYYVEMAAGPLNEGSVDVSGLSHTLSGLKKYTEYSFRVVAYNQHGPGMSTEEVIVRTLSDIPSQPPTNATLEPQSSTSILVKWNPPPRDSHNGIINSYKIRYKKSGARRGRVVETGGNMRQYLLTGLEKGSEYSIRISAQTVNGSGPPTEWHVADTPENDLDESRVPNQPSSLHVRPLTHSIVVSWTPPLDTNIMIRGYIIGYGKGFPDEYRVVVDGKTRYFTIENLEAASLYVIKVRAYNQLGEGIPIYENTYTRPKTTPEPTTPMMPPVGVKAEVKSPQAAKVTWADTTLTRNRITDNRYYTVRWMSLFPASKYFYANATSLEYIVTDLKPYTRYEFAVKVTKGRQESDYSMTVNNRTFEDKPKSPPRDLTVVGIEGNPGGVNLNWQPPAKSNGPITGYIIFYTTDPLLNDADWVFDPIMEGDKLTYTVKQLTPNTKYYFKIQARNSMGISPISPIMEYQTPPGGKSYNPVEGEVGEVPNSGGAGRSTNSPSNQSSGGFTLTDTMLWIIIACVVTVTVTIIFIIVTFILCRRRNGDNNKNKNKKRGQYKGRDNGKRKGPHKDVKPPDLWIHHEQMELKSMDKSSPQPGEMTNTPIPRNSAEMKPVDPQPMDGPQMDRRRNSFVGTDDDDLDYSSIPPVRRPPFKPKPIMIPVDHQPPPPRDPAKVQSPVGTWPRPKDFSFEPPPPPSPAPSIATSVTLNHPDPRPVSPSRPLYPRTQYSANIPRSVSVEPSPMNDVADYPPPPLSDHEIHTPGSTVSGHSYLHTPHTPSERSYTPSSEARSLGARPAHPLKSFSVPGPPPPPPYNSLPTTPQSSHLSEPKPGPSSTLSTPLSTPSKPQTPADMYPDPQTLQPPPLPEAPPGSEHSYEDDDLTTEMANLEGLMRDLNAITQSELNC
ncbi:PREDICTED: neogenin-like isoform X4 [Branchiostoma belcheri]|uniref:Neogenin-like isoform X4 n=1 Tax=Branchiostoma belcheri TaxID=7741 RepID=A0A6P4Y0G1_BRABE|nr:PREDICTED: neogenin-like isoform X4 [Branchiostoma belcheri]